MFYKKTGSNELYIIQVLSAHIRLYFVYVYIVTHIPMSSYIETLITKQYTRLKTMLIILIIYSKCVMLLTFHIFKDYCNIKYFV